MNVKTIELKKSALVRRFIDLPKLSATGKPINVSPGKLIQEIVLSPFNPPWVNNSINAAISMILNSKNLRIPIRLSEHMRGPKTPNPGLFLLEAQNALGTLGAKRKWKESMDNLRLKAQLRESNHRLA